MNWGCVYSDGLARSVKRWRGGTSPRLSFGRQMSGVSPYAVIWKRRLFESHANMSSASRCVCGDFGGKRESCGLRKYFA